MSEDLTPKRAAALSLDEAAKLAPGQEVFSRDECPFHYCDQPQGGICKATGYCRHRPGGAWPGRRRDGE
jgi:hypothetical protein